MDIHRLEGYSREDPAKAHLKGFLAETGVFGCAIPAARDSCC